MDAALQASIYNELAASVPLSSLVKGIYDGAPQANDSQDPSVMPYLTIGEDVITPWATDDWSGGEALVQVHVWSRYQGRKEAKEIMQEVRAALDRTELTVTGYKAVTCDFDQSFVDVDPDGETRHGVVEFRVLICV